MLVTIDKSPAKKLVKDVVKFATKHLGIHKSFILVNLYALEDKENYGLCHKMTDRAYMIGLNYKMLAKEEDPRKALVDTICHELVHVRQFFKDQLGYNSDDELIWHKSDSTQEEPWEVEAWELAEIMTEKYIDATLRDL